MNEIAKLATGTIPNWCAGCYDYQILGGIKKAIAGEIAKGRNKNEFAIVCGIGCHGKTFDYINLNGINTLHGRVLPTCLGLKIGNPNLNVFGFSGDGDCYAEGMEHLIHAARYNSNFNYLVFNNQTFALTVGQSTPTTEKGFSSKTNPEGVKTQPINPIALMLASGASFVARVFADMKQIDWVLKEAMKHNGFAFVEVLQPCVIFHANTGYKEKTYSLEESGHDKTNFDEAFKKAREFDYDVVEKIPLGIFYQVEKPVFEDQFSQLRKFKDNGTSWKDIKR